MQKRHVRQLTPQELAECMQPMLAADAKDWDRLIEYLEKDASAHVRFWLRTLKSVRVGLEIRCDE